MSEYITEQVQQGEEFLANHDALLQSLILSKQNANANTYTEETNGVSNGFEQSSEGIYQSGDQ